MVRDPFARHLEHTHHAKIVSAEDARRLITVDKPIEWRDLEHVVPFDVARDVVISSPSKIAVAPCACRVAAQRRGDRDPECGPVDTCLLIGDPIATFVVEHQDGARFIDAEGALGIVSAASARGNIHTIWFKDAAGDRMYALCNCCPSCCVGQKARAAGFSPVAASGHVARVESSRCTSCGLCEAACPFDAIHVPSEGVAVVDEPACMGCGACAAVCGDAAVGLVRAEGAVGPLPWERLCEGQTANP